MLNAPQKTIIEFIELYKKLPFLYDKNHPAYSSRPMRYKGHKKLLSKFKEIDENATMATMKSKLDNMRSCYIRELRKVRDAQARSTHPDDAHVPMLWYYKHFSFLEDHVLQHKRRGASNDSENIGEILYLDQEEVDDLEVYEEIKEQPQHIIMSELDDISNDQLNSIESNKSTIRSHVLEDSMLSYKSTQENEWEVIGKAIGIQLRDVDSQQAAIAQKLISDVIFYAKFGRLTEDACISGVMEAKSTYINE